MTPGLRFDLNVLNAGNRAGDTGRRAGIGDEMISSIMNILSLMCLRDTQESVQNIVRCRAH